MWRTWIDQSLPTEILAGEARDIRSDDFFVNIPFALSQRLHDPSYPVVNKLIGYQQNMLVLPFAPVKHWVSLFRLQTWGYFLGDDIGLAWSWWFNFLGLISSFFLVFCLISGNRVCLSIFASIALVFSPFMQFWSLNSASLCIFMALSFVFVIRMIYCDSKVKVFLYGLFACWAGVSFVLQFYPPYQVSLAYLFLFMVIGYVWRQFRMGNPVKKMPLRIFGLAVSASIVLLLVFLFYLETKDVFQIIMNTEYPGRRLAVGGGFPFWNLLSSIFIPWPDVKNWSFLQNICEASSFLFFFPVTCFMICRNYFFNRKIQDPFSFLLMIYIMVVLFWISQGFTPFLSKLTLFSLMPPNRAKIGLGIADMVLLVSVLSQTGETCSAYKKKWMVVSAVGAYFIFMIFIGATASDFMEEISKIRIAFGALFMAFIVFLILCKSKYVLMIIAVCSIYLSSWFNPVVFGGSSFIMENELSRKILEIDKQNGGKTEWIVFSRFNIAILSNLFRMIGVKALNGTHFYPQFEVWNKLDPELKYGQIYNRYAHIAFRTGTDVSEISINNSDSDVVIVTIHPDNPLFSKLQAEFVLCEEADMDVLDSARSLIKVGSVCKKHIYKVIKE